MHWNMRDTNYGFLPIEHRHRVLDGDPPHIDDRKLFDLAAAFVDIFGRLYATHPRLPTIMRLNDSSRLNFLAGGGKHACSSGKILCDCISPRSARVTSCATWQCWLMRGHSKPRHHGSNSTAQALKASENSSAITGSTNSPVQARSSLPSSRSLPSVTIREARALQ